MKQFEDETGHAAQFVRITVQLSPGLSLSMFARVDGDDEAKGVEIESQGFVRKQVTARAPRLHALNLLLRPVC